MEPNKLLMTIEGCDVLQFENGSLRWIAKAAIDCDGTGPKYGDPCAQNDTSLHLNGKALNADIDRYIVVPPQIITAVEGIVLGCDATVSWRGRTVKAVVGDIGPRKKIGELSVSLARDLGMNPSPTRGGVDAHEVIYTIYPGVFAVGYSLQPYRK